LRAIVGNMTVEQMIRDRENSPSGTHHRDDRGWNACRCEAQSNALLGISPTDIDTFESPPVRGRTSQRDLAPEVCRRHREMLDGLIGVDVLSSLGLSDKDCSQSVGLCGDVDNDLALRCRHGDLELL
jgi:hypothetical protein